MFWKDFLLKFLSLKSSHGGKPPLAPLTDRNKPAVWAATPREAGWICSNYMFGWRFEICMFQAGTMVSNDEHAYNGSLNCQPVQQKS